MARAETFARHTQGSARIPAVPEEEWLPAGEVAECLGITLAAVYLRRSRGALEARKVGNRLYVKMPPPAPPKPPPAPPPAPPDPNLLELSEVAELLGVTRPIAYRLAREAKLASQRRGRLYLVHRDDVAAYIEAALIVPGTRVKRAPWVRDGTPRR